MSAVSGITYWKPRLNIPKVLLVGWETRIPLTYIFCDDESEYGASTRYGTVNRSYRTEYGGIDRMTVISNHREASFDEYINTLRRHAYSCKGNYI